MQKFFRFSIILINETQFAKLSKFCKKKEAIRLFSSKYFIFVFELHVSVIKFCKNFLTKKKQLTTKQQQEEELKFLQYFI